MTKTYEEVDVRQFFFHLEIRTKKERGAKRHCDDGPADTRHCNDGSFRVKTWFRNGLRHRDDGPAETCHHKGKVFPGDTRTFEELKRAGAVVFPGWWLNGRRQY